jgi:hypothetical protein
MTEVDIHEQYQEKVRETKNYLYKIAVVFMVTLVPLSLFFAFLIGFLHGVTKTALPETFANWTVLALVSVIPAALVSILLLWKMKTSANFDCTRCDEGFNIKAPWKCGWCGALNTSNIKNDFRSALDICPSCEKPPLALACPHLTCGRDIVQDVAEYYKAPVEGNGYAGTNKFLKFVG